MHDRTAELRGIVTELANCENGPRLSRRDKADEVRAELDRVRVDLEAQAAALEAEAAQLMEKGQDGAAGQATIQARTIRAVLAEAPGDAPKKSSPAGTSRKQTTAAAKAPEQT